MAVREGPGVRPLQPDPAGRDYCTRFEEFLKLADERDIVAQFQLWDRFDFSREPWPDNPYNLRNNINYTAEESDLMTEISTHPGLGENSFFRSAPAPVPPPLDSSLHSENPDASV